MEGELQMRRFLLIMLSISILFTTLSTIVSFAGESESDQFLFTMESIIAENEYYIHEHYVDLFEQKLVDSSVEKKIESLQDSQNESNILNAISCTIQDDQLLSERETEPAISVQTKVVAISPIESKGGDQGNGSYDSSQCVYLYTSMYYLTSSSSGNTTYKMTKVAGSYSIHHSAVGVISQYVTYGQNFNAIPDAESGYLYPSSSSWNQYTYFSNYCFGAGYGVLGVNYQVEIKNYNSGSIWYYTLSNTKWI